MTRGKLSEYRKKCYQKLFEEGESQIAIARLIRLSQCAVQNALRIPKIRKERGAKKKINKKTERVIVRRAAIGDFSVRQLRDQFCPNVSIRNVQRV
eukprot:IDg749t1